MSKIDRREFMAGMALTSAAFATGGCGSVGPSRDRDPGQESVMDLVLPKMESIRFAVIGVGGRGTTTLHRLLKLDGVSVVAICDTYEPALAEQVLFVKQSTGVAPAGYTGSDYSYRDLLDREDIDAVLIATPWSWHVPMALDSMAAGKQTFVEVPAATSVEDCWKLVNASEKYRVNCMMLENACYGRDEMMVLNMVRDGVFGELTHGDAAYIHELRWQMKEIDRGTGSWRTEWHTKRNGNLYPTHGLGPIAQCMGINRGDQFDYLTSMSSAALGRQAYARRTFPADHALNKATYINGDMNTSIIQTKRGRTIMLQHDTTTPRPYSRHNLIQGTKGAFVGFPEPGGFAIESEEGGYHEWDRDVQKWYDRYDHPIWADMQARATEVGGHGGMDFVILWRIVYCLRNGLPLDQNVYDAASWSCITELSHLSVINRSKAMDIPDFTNGVWESVEPLTIPM